MTAAIDIHRLTKTYRPARREAVTAIDQLTLAIPHGQIVGVLGDAGSGRTTLLRLISGRLKPTRGSVRLNGYDVTTNRETAKQLVALLDSATTHSYVRRAVWEYLGRWERHSGSPDSVVADRAERLLRDLGLWEQRHDSVGSLAHGSQRLVALAAAILSNPPILLIDEPTHGLADHDAREVLAALPRLMVGRTVMIATTDRSVVCGLCDRIAVLSHGRLMADLPAADLCSVSQPDRYQIRVKGSLGEEWSAWFDHVTIGNGEDGEAIISGPVRDQAELHGMLARLHSLNLPLMAVSRIEPTVADLLADLRRKRAS